MKASTHHILLSGHGFLTGLILTVGLDIPILSWTFWILGAMIGIPTVLYLGTFKITS